MSREDKVSESTLDCASESKYSLVCVSVCVCVCMYVRLRAKKWLSLTRMALQSLLILAAFIVPQFD